MQLLCSKHQNIHPYTGVSNNYWIIMSFVAGAGAAPAARTEATDLNISSQYGEGIYSLCTGRHYCMLVPFVLIHQELHIDASLPTQTAFPFCPSLSSPYLLLSSLLVLVQLACTCSGAQTN